MGMRSLERALANLYGAPVRAQRWHGLPLTEENILQPVAWQDHLATRLPRGVGVDLAHRSLSDAGRELGIEFAFDRLTRLPDTREAHRLVKLADRDGRQDEVVEAIFAAFFERGRDIGDRSVLREVAEACGLSSETQRAFGDSTEGSEEIAAEAKRLRGLGVIAVPNLLINGRVLVPGPADASTYVQALDQALFPEVPGASAEKDRRLMH
jgi:predicted DsbA family dithiol-disulfide isomerase